MPNKKQALAVVLAGVWITASEFARNEFVLKHYWVEHYEGLGLTFQTVPVNGMLWTVWSLLFAYIIHRLLQQYSVSQSMVLAWLVGFVMMWLVTYNLQVLPLGLLVFAIPLSVVEVGVAALIIRKIGK